MVIDPQAHQYDYALHISWWKATKKDRDVIETDWGWINRIDTTRKQIKQNWR